MPQAYDRHVLLQEIFSRFAKTFRLDNVLVYLQETLVMGLELSSLFPLIPKAEPAADVESLEEKLSEGNIS